MYSGNSDQTDRPSNIHCTDKGQQGKLIPTTTITTSGEGNHIMPNRGTHGSMNSKPRETIA